MVLGSQPKDGNRGNASRGEVASQADSRQRLVNGVSRAAEQAHLLAGDDGHRAGLGQERESIAGAVLRGRVLRSERTDQCRAAGIGVLDFTGNGGERGRIVGIVAVKARHAVKMIAEIGKQLGGSGELGVADTGRLYER